jgi:hypothetical protein
MATNFGPESTSIDPNIVMLVKSYLSRIYIEHETEFKTTLLANFVLTTPLNNARENFCNYFWSARTTGSTVLQTVLIIDYFSCFCVIMKLVDLVKGLRFRVRVWLYCGTARFLVSFLYTTHFRWFWKLFCFVLNSLVLKL